MKIKKLEILVAEVPLRMAVHHALAERTVAHNILVRVEDDDGLVGFGECCPREYVTGETAQTVTRDLRMTLVPALLAREPTEDRIADVLQSMLEDVPRNQQAAFCALELAVLDLWGRRRNASAGDLLGPVVVPEVTYSGVLASEEPAAVKEYCMLMKKMQAQVVKVKVGTDLDKNRHLLGITREILGPETRLRIDANCGWTGAEGVRQLEGLTDFELEGVEQPVPADDFAGLRMITAAKLVPVSVDESLCSLEDAERLIAEKACNVFNLRVSKCGGLLATKRLYDRAREAGLDCQLGAQVGEMGFLSAAGRHVATRCPGLLWFEGSYGGLLLEHDVVEPDITIGPGGKARALTGPGLGVTPSSALEPCIQERIKVV